MGFPEPTLWAFNRPMTPLKVGFAQEVPKTEISFQLNDFGNLERAEIITINWGRSSVVDNEEANTKGRYILFKKESGNSHQEKRDSNLPERLFPWC